MLNKTCNTCGLTKSVREFFARGGGGLRNECKDCSRKLRKKPEPVVERPARHPWENLGLEFRRELYDPYQAGNRHGELRV